MGERIGRYELVRKIATGGMADVFLAFQWGDGGFVRDVVVKRMHAHLAERREMVEDFANEASLLAALRMPGIPAAHEFRFAEDGHWWLVMERMRGPTLAAVQGEEIALGRTCPLAVGISIVIALAELLHELHEWRDGTDEHAGIVHGDLTPGNVVIRRDGHVALLDFGIAGDTTHRRRRHGDAHGIRGTLGYIAPETVAQNTLPDHRADVFAAAVLLFELTTAQRLFPGDGLEFVNAVLDNDAPSPKDRVAGYPSALASIVLAALARDRDTRTATAGALATALSQFAEAKGIAVGRRVLADYVEARFPLADEEGLERGAPPPEVYPLPRAQQTDTDISRLSEEEHDDLLGDLDIFAPEESFRTLPPLAPSSSSMTARVKADRESAATLPAMPTPYDPATMPAPPPEDIDVDVDWPAPSAKEPSATAAAPSVVPTQTQTRAKRRDSTTEGKLPKERVSSNPPDSDGFYIYVAEDE